MKKLENLSSFKLNNSNDELESIKGGTFDKPTRYKTESRDIDGNLTDVCKHKDKTSWFSGK